MNKQNTQAILMILIGLCTTLFLWKTHLYEQDRPESTPIIFKDFSTATTTASPQDLKQQQTKCQGTINLNFVGDIMQHRAQMNSDFEASYAQTKPLFQNDDLTIGMMEFPVDPSRPVGPPPNSVQFNGTPEHLNALKNAGFDLINTANNHSFDQGVKGSIATLKQLSKHNLMSVGTGKSTRTKTPLYTTIKGQKLAFAAFTFPPNAYPDNNSGALAWWPKDAPIHALNFFDWSAEYRRQGQALFKHYAKNAKKDQAQYLIALVHWGDEWDFTPNDEQRRAARDMIDAGFDMVIGSHPHVLNGLELYKNKLIAYSLGNFISGFIEPETRTGAILNITLEEDKNEQDHKLTLTNFYTYATHTQRKNHTVTILNRNRTSAQRKTWTTARHILGGTLKEYSATPINSTACP